MLQTLFTIPTELLGIPLFGWGWALWIWLLACAVMLWLSYRRYGFGPETRGQLPVTLLFGAVLYWVAPQLQVGGPDGAGIPVRGFGVMLLLAVSSAVALALYRAKQLSFDGELVYSLAVWVFLSGILGARIFYVVQKWEQFGGSNPLELLVGIVNVTQGGIVIYGGLIGGATGFALFVYRHRLSWLAVGDLIAPSVLLGIAIGRLGCFLNGCCYGAESDVPWAVTFPRESPPYVDQQRSGALQGFRLTTDDEDNVVVTEILAGSPAEKQGLEVGDRITGIGGQSIRQMADEQHRGQLGTAGDLLQVAKTEIEIETASGKRLVWPAALPARSLPLHPTQIYSAVNASLICLFLFAYFPFQQRDGETLALFMVLYPISRFLLEIIRNDESAILGTGLTISQNVSLGILAASVAMWAYVLSRAKGTFWQSATTAT